MLRGEEFDVLQAAIVLKAEKVRFIAEDNACRMRKQAFTELPLVQGYG